MEQSKIDQTVKELEEKGGEAFGIAADVSDRDAVFNAVDKTVEKFGDLNVIVNNAGLGPTTPIDTITPEQFTKVYGVKDRKSVV